MNSILWRRLEYLRTWHCGNAGLRQSEATNLRFSILQRTPPNLEPAEISSGFDHWPSAAIQSSAMM